MQDHHNLAKTDGEKAVQLRASRVAKRPGVAGDDGAPESRVAESTLLFRAGGWGLFWALALANVLILLFLINSVAGDGSACAVKGTGRAVAVVIATPKGCQ